MGLQVAAEELPASFAEAGRHLGLATAEQGPGAGVEDEPPDEDARGLWAGAVHQDGYAAFLWAAAGVETVAEGAQLTVLQTVAH